MDIIDLTLPIHYEIEFKTKKNKKVLVGMNGYRNWHFHLSDKIKKHFHDLVKTQITNINDMGKIRLVYNIYLGNTLTDGPNVRSVVEKFILDALVEIGIIKDDNCTIVLGDTSNYFIDKNNPRAEVIIISSTKFDEANHLMLGTIN